MKKEHEKIVKQFHNACNLLAAAVGEYLFEGCRNWYWVAGEVGGVCDFDDNDYLKPEEMVYILEEGITFDEYSEWNDANLEHDQYINLPSWHRGCRHSMLNRKGKDDGQEDA